MVRQKELGEFLYHFSCEILPFATTWMDLEGIILSEISQTDKDILDDIIYMWNLKKTTN